MKLETESIKELQAIYKAESKESISYEEAEDMWGNLVTLFWIINKYKDENQK